MKYQGKGTIDPRYDCDYDHGSYGYSGPGEIVKFTIRSGADIDQILIDFETVKAALGVAAVEISQSSSFPMTSAKSELRTAECFWFMVLDMFWVTAPLRRPHCCKFYHVILSWS